MCEFTEEAYYRQLALYYVEMLDKLNDLKAEKEELDSKGEQVPPLISSEIFRHEVCVNIIAQASLEKYSKQPLDLYKDGYKFLQKV